MTGAFVLKRFQEHIGSLENVKYLHLTIDKTLASRQVARCLFIGEPQPLEYIEKNQWLNHVITQENITSYWIYCVADNFQAQYNSDFNRPIPFSRYFS